MAGPPCACTSSGVDANVSRARIASRRSRAASSSTADGGCGMPAGGRKHAASVTAACGCSSWWPLACGSRGTDAPSLSLRSCHAFLVHPPAAPRRCASAAGTQAELPDHGNAPAPQCLTAVCGQTHAQRSFSCRGSAAPSPLLSAIVFSARGLCREDLLEQLLVA